MFGKASPVSPLAARKQLLLAESELNRAQLSEEWRTLAHEVRHLAHRAKGVAVGAAAAALLAGGVTAWRRASPAPPATQPTWFQKMLTGARLASALWFAFRARGQKEERHPAPTNPEACRSGGGLRLPHLAIIMLGLELLVGCFTLAPNLAGAILPSPTGTTEANPVPESSGPTLHLDNGRGESPGNPVAEFMYFVPLISLEPVSVVMSSGNTQRARMVSATRSFSATSFVVTCEFEFNGEGNQQDVFDHAAKVLLHGRELKEGATLDHQLGSINVEGAGTVSIKVEGTMTGPVPTVTEVHLRFNGHGRPSLVSIGLHDIAYFDGAFRPRNESVARVNTLTFRSRPGPTKMDITVASVKRKDAGDTFWQNLMGGLKATTANLFLKPIAVAPAGNEAMLNFGLALASGAPSFTFPLAKISKRTEVDLRVKQSYQTHIITHEYKSTEGRRLD